MTLHEIKEKIQARALEASLLVLGPALAGALVWTENYLGQYVQQVAPSTVVRTIAVLLGLFVWMLAYAVSVRPKLKFDPDVGSYIDLKSGLRFCARCKINKNINAPLQQNIEGRGWMCHACTDYYVNPLFSALVKAKKEGRI